MENTPKEEAGKRNYPIGKQFRLGTDDAEKLAALAEQWRCSETAAVRRLIQEGWRRSVLEIKDA